MRVPKDLWGPYAVDSAEVVVYIGCFGIAEDLGSLAKIEGDRLPMYEIVTTQKIYTIVVPYARFPYTHVCRYHNISLAAVRTGDEGIACATFNAGMFFGVEDGVSANDVFVVIAVALKA